MKYDKMINIFAKYGANRFKKALKKEKNPKYKELSKEYKNRFHYYIESEDLGANNERLNSFINIFIGVTAYKICIENGYTKEESINIYDDMAYSLRSLSRKIFNLVDNFNNGFEIVKKSLKDDLEGSSSICWKAKIIKDDEQEFSYKISKCLYVDTCEKYGCREFCKVFCNHDFGTWGEMKKNVKFIRYSDLVDGDCCYDKFLRIK